MSNEIHIPALELTISPTSGNLKRMQRGSADPVENPLALSIREPVVTVPVENQLALSIREPVVASPPVKVASPPVQNQLALSTRVSSPVKVSTPQTTVREEVQKISIVPSQTGPITTPIENDISTMIDRIRSHLKAYDLVAKIDGSKVDSDVLKIPTTNGVNQISYKCVLSYMSRNPNFFPQDKDKCSNVFKTYLDSNGVDLNKLIQLSGNPVTAAGFYANLYAFSVRLFDFIANDPMFKQADPVTKQNIVNGVYDFVDQTIKYVGKAMDTYKIADGRLMETSFELLYMLNLLNVKRAMMGTSTTDITKLYVDLEQATQRNIEAYHTLMKRGQPSTITATEDPEIVALAKQVQDKIKELDAQLAALKRGEEMVAKEQASLATFVKNPVIKAIDIQTFSR